MNDKPEWIELKDKHNNSRWVASSPYMIEDRTLNWELVQKLRNNRIEWHCNSDIELTGDGGEFWLSLDEAKAAIEKAHETCLMLIENESEVSE